MGPWIVISILILSFLLIVLADLYPKIRKYKLQSPIRKIEPRKKHIRKRTKKKKSVWIKII